MGSGVKARGREKEEEDDENEEKDEEQKEEDKEKEAEEREGRGEGRGGGETTLHAYSKPSRSGGPDAVPGPFHGGFAGQKGVSPVLVEEASLQAIVPHRRAGGKKSGQGKD